MLFMHSLVKRASLPKYFSLGKPVVDTEMSGSEMIANILFFYASWTAGRICIFLSLVRLLLW